MTKTARLTAALGCAVLTFVGCVGPFAEDFESHYDTAAAAQDSIRRGWIPEGLLPPDATDIWEFHNIDTSRTWGCFLTASGAEHIRKYLSAVNASRSDDGLGGGPRKFIRVRGWWRPTSEMEVYRYRESDTFEIRMGLSPDGRRACFRRANPEARTPSN
jgi:hypothetical protein